MKQITCIFCFVFILMNYTNGQSSYKLLAKYDMELAFSKFKRFSSELYIDKNSAFFTYHQVAVSDEPDVENKTTLKDTFKYEILSDRDTRVLHELVPSFKDESSLYLTDTMENLMWKLTSETKKVGNYLSKKATCSFRGRDYVVWYTEEIHVSFGPWKLHGLPGLIIEAYDATREVYFALTSIAPTQMAIEKVDPQIATVPRKEYRDLISSQIADLSKVVQSKIDKNFKVQVQTAVVKAIEID